MNNLNNNSRAFTTRTQGKPSQLRSRVTISSNGNSKQVPAIWDTGASGTCISKEVVQELGLSPIGRRDILTPSGGDIVNVFLADVELPNKSLRKESKMVQTKKQSLVLR